VRVAEVLTLELLGAKRAASETEDTVIAPVIRNFR
jgi:hypothetical protein